jgi:hypothetical protein
LLDQRFETRFAAKRIEYRLNIDPAEIRAVAVGVALLEPAKRFFFVTDGEVNEGAIVSQSLPVWMHFGELGERLLGDIFVTHFRFSHDEKGQMQRVAAQLSGLVELCNRARQITFRLQDHAQNLPRIKKPGSSSTVFFVCAIASSYRRA